MIQLKIGGDIPIGGVILIPMILGGDIYHMHTKKRALYLKKEHICIVPGDQWSCGEYK
jgi:hypothetical protein